MNEATNQILQVIAELLAQAHERWGQVQSRVYFISDSEQSAVLSVFLSLDERMKGWQLLVSPGWPTKSEERVLYRGQVGQEDIGIALSPMGSA